MPLYLTKAISVSIAPYIKAYSFVHFNIELLWSASVNSPKSVGKTTVHLRVYRNLRYANKPDTLYSDTSSDRTLDLYTPAIESDNKLPVFLFIHGGGFSGGDKYNTSTEAFCSKLASFGYAVISMNYRLRLQ